MAQAAGGTEMEKRAEQQAPEKAQVRGRASAADVGSLWSAVLVAFQHPVFFYFKREAKPLPLYRTG